MKKHHSSKGSPRRLVALHHFGNREDFMGLAFEMRQHLQAGFLVAPPAP